MKAHRGLMVRDGAGAPPHHEGLKSLSARRCEERSDEAIQFLLCGSGLLGGVYHRAGGSRWLAMTVLVSRPHAPIAIFGSASALAFISLSARRYSTGITLRNFGKNSFQFAKISAARFDPVALAWRVIRTCSRSTSDES